MTFKQTFTEEELSIITGACVVSILAVSGIQNGVGEADNIINSFTPQQLVEYIDSYDEIVREKHTDPAKLVKQAWDILHQKWKEDEQ
jgi:hypothetical protein